ncbi:hypothetical protein [Synechococcus sp. 1G10]|nr:hypothetical protein [Synechococcus sp. 1G10]
MTDVVLPLLMVLREEVCLVTDHQRGLIDERLSQVQGGSEIESHAAYLSH